MITIKEIARLAGVSAKTAERALSGATKDIRRDARERAERVRRIAEAHGYRPSELALALRRGGVRSIGHALRCATGRSVRLSLTPVFSADRLQAELSGMISLRAGHIMLAALLGVFEYASGRISQWTSIPSKAS